MPTARIEIVGVYKLPVTDELFEKDFQARWESSTPDFDRASAIRRCREELESVVLVELVVMNPDDRFKPDDFAQTDESLPQGEWQAAWAEAYLTSDGTSYAGKFRWAPPPHGESIRMAFYMHFWDPEKSLLTSYGEVQGLATQLMPERLQRLVPYEMLG